MGPFIKIDMLIHFLNNGIVGIVTGAIIGFITSYYFSLRKHLSYQTTTIPFYPFEINNIEQYGFYKGAPVNKLRRTYFYIWNSGNAVIMSNDIPSLSPIKVTWNSTHDAPLEISIVKETNPGNNIKFNIETNELGLEYLGVRDGVIIEVVHNKRTSPQLIGTIIGSKNSSLVRKNPEPLFGEKFIFLRKRFLSLLTLLLLGGAYILSKLTGSYPFTGIFAFPDQTTYLIYLKIAFALIFLIFCFSKDIPNKLNISISDWILGNNYNSGD
ncbi:hypothetical protein [Paenibacillus apii]|uniref:hypothetical protein n=1 Tax=Paenibacillus apii TaxID=1850370 RepID=UPI00143A7223|nr:hypothetical protein [Paenibacillus apii]NJJ38407.1 hypothetical protein [Paenibacillus apii]